MNKAQIKFNCIKRTLSENLSIIQNDLTIDSFARLCFRYVTLCNGKRWTLAEPFIRLSKEWWNEYSRVFCIDCIEEKRIAKESIQELELPGSVFKGPFTLPDKQMSKLYHEYTLFLKGEEKNG